MINDKVSFIFAMGTIFFWKGIMDQRKQMLVPPKNANSAHRGDVTAESKDPVMVFFFMKNLHIK